MGLSEWKKQRARTRATRVMMEWLEDEGVQQVHGVWFHKPAVQAALVPAETTQDRSSDTLGAKVDRGDAHVMGVVPGAPGTVVVAERVSDEERMHQLVRQELAWNERFLDQPRFGVDRAEAWAPAGGKILPSVDELEADDVPDPNEPPVGDDGAVPTPDEVDAVMRAGICDSDLVGTPVVYQTDERGGKSYHLPAVVTVVQRSHPDLPALRAIEEQVPGIAPGSTDKLYQFMLHTEELESMGAHITPHGWTIGSNPVPIPLDGTVHLKVHTPGPQGSYDEFSVPYDPTGKPRTWRFLDGHEPM